VRPAASPFSACLLCTLYQEHYKMFPFSKPWPRTLYNIPFVFSPIVTRVGVLASQLGCQVVWDRLVFFYSSPVSRGARGAFSRKQGLGQNSHEKGL
jgi:hypothetical protein